MIIRVSLLYILLFQLLLVTTTCAPELANSPISVFVLFVATLLLFLTNPNGLLNNKYRIAILFYFIGLFFIVVINPKTSFHFVFRLVAPIIMICTIKEKDFKFLKPAFYILILFFICNCFLSFYEKITMSYVFEISQKDEILQQQAGGMLFLYGDEGFRSFALIGHPLDNGNIMAFMTFIIFLTSCLNKYYKTILLLMGIASLFCFNARAALMISALLFVIITISLFREQKKNFYLASLLVVFAVFIVANFDVIGGRFITGSLNDDSAMVRFYSIKEFMSLTTTEFFWGGHKPEFGENGYLMTIEMYGIFVGLLKIVFEIFFSYKAIGRSTGKIDKWVILLSLIAIGSTNNNLYYAKVFPFYLICLLFITHYSKYKRNEDPLRL